jgi:hypothetical protein
MNTIVKNINNIAGREIVEVTACKAEKLSALNSVINGKRHSYNVVGLVDRTNDVVLEPTYYNVRNPKGQFAATRTYRRSANGTFTAK